MEECVVRHTKPILSRIELLKEKCDNVSLAPTAIIAYQEEIKLLEIELKNKKLNKTSCLYERFEELDWMKISAIDVSYFKL